MAIFADAVRPILDYAASHPIPTPYTPPVVETGILVGLTAGGGTLTFSATTPADNSTITIGTKVYKFKTTLSTGPQIEGEVLIGASSTTASQNLNAAINHAAGFHLTYEVAVANSNVSSTNPASKIVIFTAKFLGTQYAAQIITIAGTSPNTFAGWIAATLTGGTDANLCTEALLDILIDLKP